MSNSDSRFMQDEELRVLLNKWNAPEAPGSLDQRVTASYRQSMSSMDERLSSALDPQRDSEVVKMKFCNSCQEQFADRFSFCPVDGTPLSAVPVAPTPPPAAKPADIETSYPMSETVSAASQRATTPPPKISVPAAAVTSAVGHDMIGEYHLTILEDTGLITRLAGELGNVAHNYQLTWPEFKRDPFGFVKRSIQGYGSMAGKFFASRDAVIAMLVSVVAMGALVGAIFLLDRSGAGGPSRRTMIAVAVIGFVGLLGIFATWLSRDRGAAVMGARPSDSRNVLSGIIASFAMLFLVVGGAFLLDRRQQARAAELAKDDDLELTQMISDIPNEQPTPDEGTAGMAKGNGGGSKPKQEKAGGGGGVGPGSGGGYGPGNGGNTGGGDRREGGGGPGGGGGGTDYSKIFSGKDVTSKARVLEKPEPTYTETARKNQITGTVVLRAVFSAIGSVPNLHAVSGL